MSLTSIDMASSLESLTQPPSRSLNLLESLKSTKVADWTRSDPDSSAIQECSTPDFFWPWSEPGTCSPSQRNGMGLTLNRVLL